MRNEFLLLVDLIVGTNLLGIQQIVAIKCVALVAAKSVYLMDTCCLDYWYYNSHYYVDLYSLENTLAVLVMKRIVE